MLSGDDTARVIYLLLLLAVIGGWVMVEFRKRGGQTLRTALAWGLIFLGLMAGYGLWQNIRHDILPMQVAAEGVVTLPRAEDGHYRAQLTIDGQNLSFMADTGASSVVLSPDDARKLGIDPATLVFTGQATTANGTVRTATVTLRNVTFGPFHDDSLIAEVNEAPMTGSLLGMDYLGRFQIQIANDQMILKR